MADKRGGQLPTPQSTIDDERDGQPGIARTPGRGARRPGLWSLTGPQDEESWAIREASRRRLEEQRRREREERSRVGWEELAQRVEKHRRREEAAAAETRLPGTSTWQADITGGCQSRRGAPGEEQIIANTAGVPFGGLPGTSQWQLDTARGGGVRGNAPGEQRVANTAAASFGGRGPPGTNVRQVGAALGQESSRGDQPVEGEGEESEEAARRLRQEAELTSQNSQRERERDAESEEARQWLERHRRSREEAAQRREGWVEHTRQRRQRARASTEPATFDHTSGIAASPELAARQNEALARVVEAANKTFQEKKEASNRRDWCDAIPSERKVDTVQSFLKAFHDEDDIEIAICWICYQQKKPRELDRVDWRRAVPEEIRAALASVFACKRCFPEEGSDVLVPICIRCREAFDRSRVPDACMGSLASIGCEHIYPKELEELTPLEEKLISLNAAYGFITKFNVQRGQPTGPTYRKHVIGHITVFPNDVESLAAAVLPHPLLATLKDVHVIWTGPERPTPRDVSKLLSVRPRILRAALVWLQFNNLLYKEVVVAEDEMMSWIFESGTEVPAAAYQRMIREDETAEERIRTAQIVPPVDRGRESPGVERTAEDIVEELAQAEAPAAVVSIEEMAAEETAQRVFELRLTGMFPIDEEAAIAEQDKLAFIGQMLQNERRDGCGGDNSIPGDADEAELPSIHVRSSGEQPFIRVSRGGDFADALSPDFFPKTFPTCFPHGRGGPRASGADTPLRNMTLESWVKVVLQRHGGRCSRHPAFAFLAFNILLRSRNRQVAHGRLQRSAFRRVEGIYERLTPERLQRAESEMRETGRTTDPDVLAIMKELSLYGSRHPLSNESRLHMRKKILALIVASGLTAVWFTINPNDINNPVKLKLAAHRGLDDAAARALLEDLRTSLQAATLSIHDPLGSTVFFFREIQLFFEHYVRVGRPSVFGKVSDYYATVETNDRGALHLHGLLWFEANVGMPELLRDMADPREAEYRAKVRRFVDDVFTEKLDETLVQAASDRGRKTTVVPAEATQNTAQLAGAFPEEAHFVASRCQVHHHSATCVKYSFKDVLKDGGEKRARTLCRFGAPWKLVPETGFSEDGLLVVERNHPMVNRYNQSMAVGLRHNHDITLILTRSMGLALMWYICNYATKLSAPMWKRLAIASELLTLIDQQKGRVAGSAGRLQEETRSFFLRLSNRVFSNRELSQPEVLAYLLGFGTDFSSVRHWTWIHLNSLYWACVRQWAGLRQALAAYGKEAQPESLYFHQRGLKLPYLEAYKHRGSVLEDVCLYDYLSFITLRKERSGRRQRASAIPFPATATTCAGWVQCLRLPGKTACPVFDGRLTDNFEEVDEKVIQWNAVLHLALFVPWERFVSDGADDIPELWQRYEESLDERLRFHVRNVALLRVSAEDAAANRKLRGLNEDFEDTIDTQAMREPVLDDVDYTDEDGAKERQAYWDAFVDVLSTAGWGSSIKELPVGAALRSLGEEADAADAVGVNDLGVGGVAESHRGRRFYIELQDIQDSPLRGFGLLGREEVAGIEKRQRKEDADIVARIRGAGEEDASTAPHQGRASVLAPRQEHRSVEMGPTMRVKLGPYASHTDVALTLTRTWTLNKQQALALLLPAAFLDDRGGRLQEEEGPQHFQYVGGEGGTGKSRVIHAIQDLFRLKEAEHALLLTGASGNAAALIGGVTLHSAAGIGFEGNSEPGRRVSEEEKLRWKSKVMLVVDEISQVGGFTLASVDNRLRQYRDDAQRPFGGIPIVVLFGDFYQFDPVQQTSLLLPRPRGYTDRSNPDSVAKHLAGHKLFLQCRSVVMLKEQVRASGCARLRGFLGRLRRGEQTELDFERLRQRVYGKPTQPTFADGLRAITPLNQDRWNLNMAAVVQHARARGQHISIFAARHHTEPGRQFDTEELREVLRYGDDSHLPTPGLFFYVQGMPVVATRNLHVGLKLVNGAPFKAMDVIPDPAYATIAVADDVTFHLGPPLAVLLQSDAIADLAIPGLPPGTMLLPSKTVAIPEAMRGKGGPRSRGKPGFRWVTNRTGPLCTPAFAMTDQKSQGKQFANVLLNLKGSKPGTGQGEGIRPSFMSLYVQLSRATRWEGLYLFREPARSDFIEPKNVLDSDMREAVARLERQGSETRARFRREHGQKSWFAAWEATEEASAAGEDAGEDTTLW